MGGTHERAPSACMLPLTIFRGRETDAVKRQELIRRKYDAAGALMGRKMHDRPRTVLVLNENKFNNHAII